MTTCPHCQREVPESADFCPHADCRQYLRWEQTGIMPAVPAPKPPPQPARTAPEPPAAPPPVPAGRSAEPAPPVSAPPSSPAESAPPSSPPVSAPPSNASITLSVPGVEAPAGGGPAAIALDPGRRGEVVALVRNQSTVVENFELRVEGLGSDAWVTISPATVHLLPYGSAGGYEQEVRITLHPPRDATAEARHWPLQVVASSLPSRSPAGSTELALVLRPFEQMELKVLPDRRAGRRRARFDVSVRNLANAPASVALGARDTDGECRVSFDAPTLDIAQGATQRAILTVRPPRQMWIGRPLDRRIEVSHATGEEGERLLQRADEQAAAQKRRLPGIRPPKLQGPSVNAGAGGVQVAPPRLQPPHVPRLHLGGGQVDIAKLLPGGAAAAEAAPAVPLLPSQAVFRQRAWLPWWLAIAAPMLAALLLMLVLFLPRNTEVPKLIGKPTVLEAQKALADADLMLSPAVEKVVKPGARGVIEQVPDAGTKLEKGKSVTIQVAVGSTTVAAPDLTGQTLPDAEKTLRKAGLTVGRTSVTPPDLKAKIISQVPEPKELIKRGGPVDIYYEAIDGKGDAEGKGKDGEGGKKVAIPEIDPPDAAAYAAKLSEAGFVPQVIQQIDAAAKGTVFSTDPAVGKEAAKGATVKVLVSSGFPKVVFDDDEDVRLVGGATGKLLTPVAKSSIEEKDPTWSADGTQVAYSAAGRIMLADVTKPDVEPTALTPADESYWDPSFAPTPGKGVLALVKQTSPTDGNARVLCFAAITDEGTKPSCRKDEGIAMSDVKWAPDGRTILVPAVKKTGELGLAQYTLREGADPFSPLPTDWKGGTIKTPTNTTANTGVRDGAFSPDGKKLALVSNVNTDQYRLFITTPDDLSLKQAEALPVQACKVAWRQDGKELLVTQSGADCSQGTGQLLRVGALGNHASSPLSAAGDNASYQPLLGGG
jgi:beta-lactam-binding protein with PASTA domain